MRRAATPMNDTADATGVSATRNRPATRRARVLGLLSLVLGGSSFAVLPVPLPSAFPWLTIALSLAGIVVAIMALRTRPRGRLAAGLAIAGLLLSLTFPALVVFVFLRYINWKS